MPPVRFHLLWTCHLHLATSLPVWTYRLYCRAIRYWRIVKNRIACWRLTAIGPIRPGTINDLKLYAGIGTPTFFWRRWLRSRRDWRGWCSRCGWDGRGCRGWWAIRTCCTRAPIFPIFIVRVPPDCNSVASRSWGASLILAISCIISVSSPSMPYVELNIKNGLESRPTRSIGFGFLQGQLQAVQEKPSGIYRLWRYCDVQSHGPLHGLKGQGRQFWVGGAW